MLSNRQENIQKLVVAKVETSSMTTASHLKQMKLRELMANGYSVVQKFVNTVIRSGEEVVSPYFEWNMRTPMTPCLNH